MPGNDGLGDLLLRWMSETGGGQLSDVLARIQWIAGTAGLDRSRAAAGRWLRDVSALGHAEIDWENGRWAVNRPAVARLPHADGTAVLVGSRRSGLLEALDTGEIDIHAVAESTPGRVIPCPAAILLQYESAAAITAAAARAGITYAGCAAQDLAAALPLLGLGDLAGPPARGSATVERLRSDDSLEFAPSAAAGIYADGLYRLVIQGRKRYLYREGGSWRFCSRSAGVFADLQRRGHSVLRWRPDGPAPARAGTLFVDWGAPLPAPHARVLVLCSGLPAQFSSGARTASYRNVPWGIAVQVAVSLRQHVTRLDPLPRPVAATAARLARIKP